MRRGKIYLIKELLKQRPVSVQELVHYASSTEYTVREVLYQIKKVGSLKRIKEGGIYKYSYIQTSIQTVESVIVKEGYIMNDIIKSIGVELEGGCNIDELRAIKAKFPTAEQTSDASVYVSRKYYCNCELKYWNEDVNKVWDFIKHSFHCGFEQNASCGNHVHLKINSEVLGILTTSKFNELIVKWYKEKYLLKPKYLNRLNGIWCSPAYNINSVIKCLQTTRKHDRYHFVNCNSYPIHGTIEIRVMPWMKSADEYIKSMAEMLNEIVEIVKIIKAKSEYSLPSINIQKDYFENRSISLSKLRKKIVINSEAI